MSFSWSNSWLLGLCALFVVGLATLSAEQSPAPSAAPDEVLARYCLTCHNQRMKERGTVPVALDNRDLTKIAGNVEVWERAVLKLRAGLMPPAGAARPDRAAHDVLVNWLESERDRAAAADPNPGRTEPFHRLNRT